MSALGSARPARDRDKALHYFQANQPRMHYARFRLSQGASS
jgi:hypothetical protein